MATLALTDNQLLSDLSDEIKKTQSALPAYWSNIVPQSHAWAVNQIVGRLAARGYSYAQIQTSDQTADLERSLTLFMALKRAGTVEGYNDANLKALDAREELKETCLTLAGVIITPAGPIGVPNSGSIQTQQEWHPHWADEEVARGDDPGDDFN